jgi:hypothetical protein
MRKAAGIILIALGVLFISLLIYTVVGLGITTYRAPFDGSIEGLYTGVFIVVFAISAAFHIAGGIFCLWREYWRVCLASASFAVFIGFFGVVLFYWIDWPIWVMLVAAVIAVVFILRTKKEWQEISD